MKEQDYIVKDGMIQVKLDRVSDKPIISEVPEKYKNKIILDMWSESKIEFFNTVSNEPELMTVKNFKGWVLHKGKLKLINGTTELRKLDEEK